MPVNSKHPLYKRWVSDWRLSRAVCDGERSVKHPDIREMTLPKLSGHVGDPAAYNQYVSSAHFFPGAGRYREGLLGSLFQTDASIDLGGASPERVAPFLNNVTGSSSPCSVQEFLRSYVGRELATTGRLGVLTDFPLVDQPRSLTVEDVERMSLLPVLQMYTAEQIINWREEVSGQRRRLTMVVLEEDVEVEDEDDLFVIDSEKVWRVLSLQTPTREEDVTALPAGATRAYASQVYRKVEDEIVPGPLIFPRVEGRLLEEIPFDILNSTNCDIGGRGVDLKSVDPTSIKPPLLDLVNINLAHFRNSAIFEHALIFVGSPQPWITGFDKVRELGVALAERGVDEAQVTEEMSVNDFDVLQDFTRWRVGAARLITIGNSDARLGFLSLKSQDISALSQSMEAKVAEMVAVGGRLLAPDKRAAEAAQTEEIRRRGERSIISVMVSNLESSASRWLSRALQWMGVEDEVRVSIDTDFMSMMTGAEALAFSDLHIRGEIARTDLLDLYKRSGLVDPERTPEDIDRENAVDPALDPSGSLA